MGNTMAGSKLQSLQLAESLNGYSIEAIKASISESTLNEMQIRAILSQKGLTGNILETTTAELANTTALMLWLRLRVLLPLQQENSRLL